MGWDGIGMEISGWGYAKSTFGANNRGFPDALGLMAWGLGYLSAGRVWAE